MDSLSLYKQLAKLGFKEKTAKVYMALLSLGSTSITELAKHASLKRPTVYVCLDELKQRNLVSSVKQGKRDLYQPQSFDAVLYDRLEEARMAEKITQELKALPILNPHSQTYFYQGRKQFTHILDEAMRGKKLCVLVYLENYWKLLGEEHNRHLYEVIKRAGGFVRGLTPKTKKTIDYLSKKYRKGLQEYRFLPPHFDTSNETSFLVNDKMVLFTSYDSLTATAIKDQNIIKLMRQMWQTLWDQSEPFKG